MEIKELFDALSACKHPDEMRGIMDREEIYRFAYGGTSVAYRVGDYVIKHSRMSDECHTPSAETLNNELLARLWLAPVYQSKYVIVQPFCKPIRNKARERRIIEIIDRELKNMGIDTGAKYHRLHVGNFGLYKGKIKVFDMV